MEVDSGRGQDNDMYSWKLYWQMYEISHRQEGKWKMSPLASHGMHSVHSSSLAPNEKQDIQIASLKFSLVQFDYLDTFTQMECMTVKREEKMVMMDEKDVVKNDKM